MFVIALAVLFVERSEATGWVGFAGWAGCWTGSIYERYKVFIRRSSASIYILYIYFTFIYSKREFRIFLIPNYVFFESFSEWNCD